MPSVPQRWKHLTETVTRRWRAQVKGLHQSLLWRVTLAGLALLLLGLVTRVTVVLPYVRTDMVAIVVAQQQTLAHFVARDIDHKLNTRLDALSRLAAHLPPTVLQDPGDLGPWLATSQRLNPALFTHIRLLPVNPTEQPWWPGQPEHVQRELQQGRAVVGQPLPGDTPQQAEIAFAVPVPDANHRVVAILVAGVPVVHPGFLDGLDPARSRQDTTFSLIAPRYQTVVLGHIPAPGKNALHDQAMAGFRGGAVDTDTQGHQSVIAFADVPSAGWFLAVSVPYDVIAKPIDQLGTLFARASGVQMVVFIAFIVFVLRTMLKPLTQAAVQLRHMASGRMALRPLPVVRQDEAGELAGGFNHLLQQLEANMAKLQDNEARLAQLARLDPLTGLPNRTVLHERLQQVSDQATRVNQTVSLLFLDLDGFKAINDRYGHQAGDAVLLEVAQRLQQGRRKADLVVRLGGDEFVILLHHPNGDALWVAEQVAQQCIDAIRQPIHAQALTLELGVSIGVAHQQRGESAEFLLIEADTAMYAAKHSGRNRHCTYDPNMRQTPSSAPHADNDKVAVTEQKISL